MHFEFCNCVFFQKHHSTYLSLLRIFTPNPSTSEPLYVVNIYQVSFYSAAQRVECSGFTAGGQASQANDLNMYALDLTIFLWGYFPFRFVKDFCGQVHVFCIELN